MKLFAFTIVFIMLSMRPPEACGKKLIEYGWDCPSTKFLRENIARMETIPFDGVVMQVTHPKTGQSLGWRVFSKVKFRPSEYAHAIRDLANLKPKRLTDNFIQVIAMPGDVDWFDDEWSAVAHNAACLARVTKLGGCKGIMFDPEHYGPNTIWSYANLPPEKKAKYSYEAYAAMVKERGKQFIQAINREFPNIIILALYGHSLPYQQAKEAGGLSDAEYGLLAAFYDGICEGADSGTILIDGYEQSYPFRERKLFENGRQVILEHARTISTVPKAFQKHVRAGFGVWADYASGQLGWHPEDFTKNYYSPAALKDSLCYALEHSDGYVWVYSERLRWWDFNVPNEYVDALALAKTTCGKETSGRKIVSESPVPRAAEQAGYSDEDTFAEIRKNLTQVANLPKEGWRFNRDEENKGEKEGWHKVDFDDSTWRTISIGKFWEEQGEDYDGVAWYRLRFTLPKGEEFKEDETTRHKLFLVFGAVDESAWIWLNGTFVGSHDIGPIGWTMPIKVEVTEAIRLSSENVLAVKVLDSKGAGGIWKSVKLMARR